MSPPSRPPPHILERIPNEIILLILQRLPTRTLYHLRQVNRHLNHIIGINPIPQSHKSQYLITIDRMTQLKMIEYLLDEEDRPETIHSQDYLTCYTYSMPYFIDAEGCCKMLPEIQFSYRQRQKTRGCDRLERRTRICMDCEEECIARRLLKDERYVLFRDKNNVPKFKCSFCMRTKTRYKDLCDMGRCRNCTEHGGWHWDKK
ncbi:MAG: hypothetical protein M1834_004958 [Cirrosporium novae-zelandiae]|nr:MAG: hypothetical protein M1834_004958 [Cirrosporium novae-zelandiae]